MMSLSSKELVQARSLISWLASLNSNERTETILSLSPSEQTTVTEMMHEWAIFARPNQLPPQGGWFVWLIQAGRGFGKTRSGAEYVRARIDAGEWRVVNIAGPSTGDVMDYMVRGTSAAPGLMGIWPPHQRPRLNKAERRLTCHNGAIIRYRAAFEADTDFRGPQADGGWADEIDAWKPRGMKPDDAWDLFEMGIRLGADPRIVATSTPKRARLVRSLRQRDDVEVSRGSTYDNAENLAPKYLKMIERFKGTHKERQEIQGELITEIPGSLVNQNMIDVARVDTCPSLVRISVGVDPSGSTTGDSQGIVVAGKDANGHGYVLADRSCQELPEGWGRKAVLAATEFGTRRIVVETNYGGDMAASVIRQAARALGTSVQVITVNASSGKHVRFADNLAIVYEQFRMHHVGTFETLEDEVCAFTLDGYDGDGSPDPADALVWAAKDLDLAEIRREVRVS